MQTKINKFSLKTQILTTSLASEAANLALLTSSSSSSSLSLDDNNCVKQKQHSEQHPIKCNNMLLELNTIKTNKSNNIGNYTDSSCNHSPDSSGCMSDSSCLNSACSISAAACCHSNCCLILSPSSSSSTTDSVAFSLSSFSSSFELSYTKDNSNYIPSANHYMGRRERSCNNTCNMHTSTTSLEATATTTPTPITIAMFGNNNSCSSNNDNNAANRDCNESNQNMIRSISNCHRNSNRDVIAAGCDGGACNSLPWTTTISNIFCNSNSSNNHSNISNRNSLNALIKLAIILIFLAICGKC